jgi:hypothetical protein|tara:strand:- start:32 stop:442 length:411 start_codon:yes stop_codon:yes gene_type:complete
VIHGIQSKDVNDAWQYAEEFIVDALKHGIGEYLPEDIKLMCQHQRMQLWIKWSDKGPIGAFVTQILNYPQLNVLLVLLLGGKTFLEWKTEIDEILVGYGKEHNCKYVEFFGRKGWKNYLKDINYNEQVRMFAKEIV